MTEFVVCHFTPCSKRRASGENVVVPGTPIRLLVSVLHARDGRNCAIVS